MYKLSFGSGTDFEKTVYVNSRFAVAIKILTMMWFYDFADIEKVG